MARPDTVDVLLAARFAWVYLRPEETHLAGESIAAIDADAAPAGERADEQVQERAAGRTIVAAIGRAWALTDDEERFQATKRLLGRASRRIVSGLGLDGAPLEAVRLLRLLVRYASRMTRKQRQRAATVASQIFLDDPEAADLLVEIARSGDEAIAEALFGDDDCLLSVGDEAALIARLADVIDDGPTHEARAVAIDLVQRFESLGPAREALQRALCLPSFEVRARALEALVTATPCLLSPDALSRVLHDLVTHAPPDFLNAGDEVEEDERRFADAVLVALTHVRPQDAAEALLDWIDAEYDTLWLDAGWATEALAIGFPETGTAMVDHWLKCARTHERTRALGAIARLSDELARPRLELACCDPSPAVRERAQEQWRGRFSQPFPLSSRALIGGALCSSEPGDRFLPRLAVLHGRVNEARQAMGRALLAEAPDPEALVLLLQLVGDDGESSEPLSTWRDGGWAQTLVERFGAAAVQGLCALASRFSEPEVFGWMRRLGDLVERGIIAPQDTAPIRELACNHLLSESAGQLNDSLRLLALVGAPPMLLDRVLTVALSEDPGCWEARKLVVGWPDRATDVRLSSEMALGLASRDWPRLESAAWMALARGAPAAKVVAERVLEVVINDEEVMDAAIACAQGLRQQGVLDDAWAAAALGQPESPLFVVAARAWRGSAAVTKELTAALASSAREGAAAAEAALALLASDPPWNPRDRRLPAVLAAAPAPTRAELLSMMCIRGAPFAAVAPHLDSLFTSSDPQVAYRMQGLIGFLKSRKLRPLLRQILPRVVDADLRTEIEDELGHTRPSYWAER